MYTVADSANSNVPAFLGKLWTLVEDPEYDDLICWSESGKSFHVFDQARFSREVLPKFFKHNNIASFVRQLNMYGFRKVVNLDQGALRVEKDDLEFQHIYFQQGQQHLLENIKRKLPNVKLDSMKLKQEDVSLVLSDVSALRGKQDNMSSKLEHLRRENDALWREVASLRQLHQQQQQIVNKLVQFLVTLVGGNRSLAGVKRKYPLMISDATQRAKKTTKLSRPLSIEEGKEDYAVESPLDRAIVPQSKNGPIIHDVTDLLTMPSDLSEANASAENEQPDNNQVKKDDSQPSSAVMATLSRADTQALINALATMSSAPTATVTSTGANAIAANPSSTAVSSSNGCLNKEFSEHLDEVQYDLDNLKYYLSGNTINVDPSTLTELFTPDANAVPDLPIPGLDDDAKPGSSQNIVGNELMAYNPQEDLPALFDLSEGVDDNALIDLSWDVDNLKSLQENSALDMSRPAASSSKLDTEGLGLD